MTKHWVSLITVARKIIWEAFKSDPDFKQTYVDNVACLLIDTLGITDYKTRNEAAKTIVDYMYKEE
jgi:hypothetical protein